MAVESTECRFQIEEIELERATYCFVSQKWLEIFENKDRLSRVPHHSS